MVVSFPETIGQLTGSEVVGADPGQSDRSTGEVCMGFRDEEEEEATGRLREDTGVSERGLESDVERGREEEEEEERLLERLMESLTVTRCLRIKLDT